QKLKHGKDLVVRWPLLHDVATPQAFDRESFSVRTLHKVASESPRSPVGAIRSSSRTTWDTRLTRRGTALPGSNPATHTPRPVTTHSDRPPRRRPPWSRPNRRPASEVMRCD